MVGGWGPPTGAGSCCDLQSLYLTREINYFWQMSRSKRETGVGGVHFDWHGRSSQRFLPEGFLSDLVMPGVVGHPASTQRHLPGLLLSSSAFIPCGNTAHVRLQPWKQREELLSGRTHLCFWSSLSGTSERDSLMRRTHPWLLLKSDYLSCCQFLCVVFSFFWLGSHCEMSGRSAPATISKYMQHCLVLRENNNRPNDPR